jgi:hypothetical protein
MVVIDRRRVIIYIYYTADNTYYTFEKKKKCLVDTHTIWVYTDLDWV